MTTDTVIGIGSVTKSVTAVAVMLLQEQGKLSVHDPVVRYLPRFRTPRPGHAENVTIHHLLTHSSGLPPLPTLWYVMQDSIKDDPALKVLPHQVDLTEAPRIDTVDQLLDYLAEADYQVIGEPGQYFSYSNDGYALLGAVVAQVSGQSYESFVVENVLEPLGMEYSTFDLDLLASWPHVAQLYALIPDAEGRPTATADPGWWEGPVMHPAGFLRSTVDDMIRYLQIFVDGGRSGDVRILSEDSVRAMTTAHIETVAGRGYGYGWEIGKVNGYKVVEHGGGTKGGACMALVVPEAGVTGVVLASFDQSPILEAANAGLNLALGLPLEAPRGDAVEPSTPAPHEFEAYLGEYATDEGMAFHVVPHPQGIALEVMGQSVPLRPVAADTFAYNIGPLSSYVRFHRGDDGSVRYCLNGYRLARRRG